MLDNSFITPITPLGEISGLRSLQDDLPQKGNEQPFKDIFNAAIQNLKDTEIISNNDTAQLALGDIDDLHTLGIDATKAYLAERLVVELRNRAMEAYSEIMRINL